MKNIILFIFGISFLLIIGLLALSTLSGKAKTPTVSYQKTDGERPRLVVDKTEFDFGTIKVKDEASTDFILKNEGKKPLQITGINSSCNCTSAQFIYQGKESAEFGMHNPGREIFEIAPGDSAIIKAIYKPFVMPVYGFVAREIYIESNDPDLPRVILKVKTTVTK